ncbi:alpha/beta hydrolase [Jiulongibacter sediminis]|jgi:acetyl esterase/lipase|uniref:alpha/beta hydrolase n=1 Tax=Jiulongibacter sediminis TaxID=1605367 RepID=UPI0026E99C66|nr:alpha/beta hydrolase [Jiulongibacter sediminis]
MKKLLFLILICNISIAQQVIPLYEGLPPNSLETTDEESTGAENPGWFTTVLTPTLTLYLPEQSKKTGTAVIVCPGGGYTGLAMQHEGHDIAKKLQENGIAGIVLKYRLPNPKYVENKEVVPLQDAQRAIQLVREKAGEWGIDPTKLGIMGSSAGGHLVSTVGTHFDKAQISNPLNTSLRPDFLILNYPVISFKPGITHNGSRYNLVGELSLSDYADKFGHDSKFFPVPLNKVEEYSNELRVTIDTPPTFIMHAVDDKVVPVENSLFFISSLLQHGVEVESFFYEKGGHGFGMTNPEAKVQWIDACLSWILERR